ncbi:DUF4199 domain-containing protein [Desertivirga arenae]|uniref:DUF4199 domain-containing protein n=1 Tax=Desertivirga arenae TaxID=2810309 RepID=UPI001A96F6D4|nr:DUF4199 domain-containing protein [Pedobacter sp. SYSU D00823]
MIDKRSMQKQAAVYGLLYGVVILIIGIIALYWIASTRAMPVIIASPVLLSFAIPVGLAIFFTLKLRNYAGGYWSMREAASGIFIMFLTAYFIYSLGNYVYAHKVDKGITERVQLNIVKVTTDFASKQNVPTEELDEKIDQIKESIEAGKNPTVGHIIQGIFFSIIIIFVAALIFAAIFKKEPPVFAKSVSE